MISPLQTAKLAGIAQQSVPHGDLTSIDPTPLNLNQD